MPQVTACEVWKTKTGTVCEVIVLRGLLRDAVCEGSWHLCYQDIEFTEPSVAINNPFHFPTPNSFSFTPQPKHTPKMQSSSQESPSKKPEEPSSKPTPMKLPGPFHPLVFESRNGSKTNSPSSSRPSSSLSPLPPHHPARKPATAPQRQLQQLQQYRREVLARAATSLMSPPPNPSDAPRAPHLAPLGSPGPATPLNLEEPKDYLSAGAIGEGSPRSTAERYIREEQERCNGIRADHSSSPAVSPRC